MSIDEHRSANQGGSRHVVDEHGHVVRSDGAGLDPRGVLRALNFQQLASTRLRGSVHAYSMAVGK